MSCESMLYEIIEEYLAEEGCSIITKIIKHVLKNGGYNVANQFSYYHSGKRDMIIHIMHVYNQYHDKISSIRITIEENIDVKIQFSMGECRLDLCNPNALSNMLEVIKNREKYIIEGMKERLYLLLLDLGTDPDSITYRVFPGRVHGYVDGEHRLTVTHNGKYRRYSRGKMVYTNTSLSSRHIYRMFNKEGPV